MHKLILEDLLEIFSTPGVENFLNFYNCADDLSEGNFFLNSSVTGCRITVSLQSNNDNKICTIGVTYPDEKAESVSFFDRLLTTDTERALNNRVWELLEIYSGVSIANKRKTLAKVLETVKNEAN